MLRNRKQKEEAQTREQEEGPTTTGGDDRPSKSRRTKFLQGATVFVVLFVAMYAALRWATSRDEERTD